MSSRICLLRNEILMARTQGIWRDLQGTRRNSGITGPMLRATGVNYDIRKVDKYGIYERFDFRFLSASTEMFTTATCSACWRCASR